MFCFLLLLLIKVSIKHVVASAHAQLFPLVITVGNMFPPLITVGNAFPLVITNSITMADFITMADKITASISHIRTVSKKKATIENILAHPSKSEICDKTWSTESLKVLLSDMTAKNQIELVDSSYKIKQNEAQDDNDNEAEDDNDDNCNFFKHTQIDYTFSVSDNLVAKLET